MPHPCSHLSRGAASSQPQDSVLGSCINHPLSHQHHGTERAQLQRWGSSPSPCTQLLQGFPSSSSSTTSARPRALIAPRTPLEPTKGPWGWGQGSSLSLA